VSAMDDFLAHFGVKGMKWGVRRSSKAKEAPSHDAATATAIKKRAKAGKVKVLSNTELQQAINRMNLEQQFKRLSVNEKPAVQRWVASTLLEIGKREVSTAAGKKLGAMVAKKVVTGGVA
jgi:hypothetical protein